MEIEVNNQPFQAMDRDQFDLSENQNGIQKNKLIED